jgi:hypothetical protein
MNTRSKLSGARVAPELGEGFGGVAEPEVDTVIDPGPRPVTGLATPSHLSVMSQVTTRPPGGRARAMHNVLYPVNVPISSTRRAPMRRVRNARNCPSSGMTCITPPMGSPAVSARSFRRISSSRNETFLT